LEMMSTSKRFKGHVDVWYYGVDGDYDINATNVVRDTEGSHFDVTVEGEPYGHFDIHQFGEHNIENSLAVIGFCYLEDIPAEKVRASLDSFRWGETAVQRSIRWGM